MRTIKALTNTERTIYLDVTCKDSKNVFYIQLFGAVDRQTMRFERGASDPAGDESEKTKRGYTLIECKRSFMGALVALIDRNLRGDLVESFVVAWGYDFETDSWCQGHYFTTLDAARDYFNNNY